MRYQFSLSERRACQLVGLSRTGHRYRRKPNNDEQVRARLKELTAQYPRYGYLMLHQLLKREELVINKKRTYRLYTNEGLQVSTKKRKKLTRPRQPMIVPTSRNQRWSMDFVSDQLANGRRFRIFNIVDDYSRECVLQIIDVSISGKRLSRELTQLANYRKLPNQIICDNGPEFTSKAMFFWQQQTSVKLGFIQPGKPTQNAFVESLNGKFRNECLNQHWFRSIEEAKKLIDQWRHRYNTVRPHSSLNYQTPIAFAQQAA